MRKLIEKEHLLLFNRGRKRSLDFEPDRKVVISGDRELRMMRAQKNKYGRFIS